MVRGVGFEPTNPYGTAASGCFAPNGGVLLYDGTITFEKFREWVFKEYRHFTALDRFRYAKKYAYCLVKSDLTDLKMLSNSKRVHVLKALTTLSKILGIYENFRTLIKNYGLKCSEQNTDQVIINRLMKTVDSNEIFQWIRQVKECIPELSDFIDFLAVTGLRFIEAIDSYNLIVDLANKQKLNEYYNSEKEILEHFRFKTTFIRNSKKVFISFVPKHLIDSISQNNNKHLDYAKVRKVVEYRIGKMRFADMRELHGTLATKYLKESEIDFLHGRIGLSVFMKNYFNVALISDLKARTFQAIKEIYEKANPSMLTVLA